MKPESQQQCNLPLYLVLRTYVRTYVRKYRNILSDVKDSNYFVCSNIHVGTVRVAYVRTEINKIWTK